MSVTDLGTAGILALIRAGALARAWTEFVKQGLDEIDDEPAVLTLHGRLLKERARGEDEEGKRRGFLASAEMYAKAAQCEHTTYPLINAASLSLLGGDGRRARVLAELTLARLDDPKTEPDTPYYIAATRAEALLLLEQVDAARASLEEALAAAPKAYEDHATTFRQFALILSHMGLSVDWLDRMRPPHSLHFAGHMSILPGDDAAVQAISDRLDAMDTCFGYGALAAGTDILVAEAILARGGTLNVVLPGSVAQFRAESVTSRGDEWGPRFDALIDAAEHVVEIPYGGDADHMLGIKLAGDIAMGMAARNAALIESSACQLLVMRGVDLSQPGITAMLGRTWQVSGRVQEYLQLAGAEDTRSLPPERPETGPLLAAAAELDLGSAEAVSALLVDPRLAEELATLPAPVSPPGWQGSMIAFAYADPKDTLAAAAIVTKLVPEDDVRLAFDFGIGTCVHEPFAGGRLLTGAPTLAAARMLDAVPLGARYASSAFFHALLARDSTIRGELMGELDDQDGTPIELYALR